MSGLFWNDYPYTDFHELNLTFLIKKMIELNETVKNFVSLNAIKYADPIQWNIASQYEKNTVVVDPQTGTAYLSVAPVPSGVAITNPDYWTVIFDLDIAQANNNITLRDDGNNVLSTFTSDVGDWLLWNGILYRVTQNIGLSQAYVIGYNIERYTVEDFVKSYVTALNSRINDVILTIGDLNDLDTTDKSSIVSAINELVGVNENRRIYNVVDYGAVGDGVTDDTDAIKACIEDGKYNTIYFPSGTYLISDSLTLYSLTTYVGAGINTTLIKVADNSNCGVFKSYDYDNYILSPYTIANTKDPESMKGLAGSSFTAIKDMTIDAGFMNFSGGIVNTSGHGIAYIGKGLTIEDVEICNAPNVGLMISMFYCNDFWADTSNGSHDINLQGFINRLEVHDTGNEAIIKHGLQDPHCDNLRVYRALQSNASFESLSPISGVAMIAGSGTLGAMTFGSAHIHTITNGYGLGLYGPVRILANQLIVEGCHDGIYTGGGGVSYGSISNLDFHDITGIAFKYFARIIISNLDVYQMRNNATVFDIDGGIINVLGGYIAGHKPNPSDPYNTLTVFSGSGSTSLAKISLQTQHVTTFNTIGFSRSIIKLTSLDVMSLGSFQRCDLEFIDNTNGDMSFANLGDLLYLNHVNYRSKTGAYPSLSHGGNNIGIDSTITTHQVITVTAPDNIGVTETWRYHLEILGTLAIKYCYCSAVVGNSITFELALSVAGGGYTGYNLYIK